MMRYMLLLLLVTVGDLVNAQTCTNQQRILNKFGYQKSANQGINSNYFYLGGVLSVSSSGANILECGAPTDEGIALVEAFFWSLRQRPAGLLPGISVGGVILDACNSGSLLGQQLANLETCQARLGQPTPTLWVQPENILGYVGPHNSQYAKQTLDLLKAKEKTSISFGLNAPEYGQTSTFPYLIRLSPTDKMRVDAMVALMKKELWKYIQVIYTNSLPSSKELYEYLKAQLASTDICIVQNLIYDNNGDDVMTSLNKFKTTRPVVVFMTDAMISVLFKSATKNPGSGYYTWLLPSEKPPTFAADVQDVAAGTLIFLDSPSYSRVVNFQEFFKTLLPGAAVRARNPWFDAWWSKRFNCNVPGISGTLGRVCSNSTDNLKKLPSSAISPNAAYALQAVDLFLNGLHKAILDTCTSGFTGGVCTGFSTSNSKSVTVMQKMFGKPVNMKVNVFQSNRTARDFKISFFNYRRKGGKCQQTCFAPIGFYSLTDNLKTPLVTMTDTVYSYGPPPLNSIQRNAGSKCGPGCPSFCPVKGSTAVPTTTAVASTQKTTSIPPKPPLRFREAYWVFALIVLAGLGILMTLILEIYILTKIGSSGTLHMRTLWLGQILLLAIFLGYLLLFAWVPWPNRHMCGLIRFGVGGVYALAFSVLLIKLMVLLNSKTVGYLSGVYQLLMLLFAWGVQIVINAQWLILRVPQATFSSSLNRWVCNHTFDAHLQSLVYCMFLILVCTLLAVRTHSIVTNFREGMFIGLVSGFSIPIWITWGLVGGLNSNYEMKEAAVPYGLFINLTLILLIMFIPKVRQLNTQGTEAIYREDARSSIIVTPRPEFYTSGASVKSGSVIMSPGNLTLQPIQVTSPDGQVKTVITEELWENGRGVRDPNSLHLKHPGSTRRTQTQVIHEPVTYNNQHWTSVGVPATAATTGRIPKISNELTGKTTLLTPRPQSGGSEIAYPASRTAPRSVRSQRSHKSAHLGSL